MGEFESQQDLREDLLFWKASQYLVKESNGDQAGGIGLGVQDFGGRSGAQERFIEHTEDAKPGFVGIAVGVEFGLDVGALGPLPEEFFLLGLGFGLLQGEALLLEGESAGNEIAAAESDDVAEVVSEFAQVRFRGSGERSGLGGGGEAGGDPVDEVVDEG